MIGGLLIHNAGSLLIQVVVNDRWFLNAGGLLIQVVVNDRWSLNAVIYTTQHDFMIEITRLSPD